MADLTTSDFLNNEIGKLGSVPKFELPENFKKIWAPTGQSLEEINRRKSAIRSFQRELDTKVIIFGISNSGAAANGVYYSGYVVPQNKKIFIWGAEISYFNANTAAYGSVSYGFYNEGSSSSDTDLCISTLPPAVAAAVNPYTSHSIPFTYPVVGKDSQKLGIELTNFVGRAEVIFWYWIEDKDIIA